MAKDDIVDVDEGPGTDTFATGLVIFTTIALIACWFIIQHAHKVNYGAGPLAG